MLLEDVFHRVEAGLERLGRALFQPDPQSQLRADIAELTAELRERHEQLRQTRQKLREAQRRLEENRQAVKHLAVRVERAVRDQEGPQAYHLALEVDKLRQEIARDEERVPRGEQAVWSIEFK